MTEAKKKFIVVSIPLMGALIWSFISMINSFSTPDSWRIVFSTVGFSVFFILGVLLLRQWKEEEKEEQEGE